MSLPRNFSLGIDSFNTILSQEVHALDRSVRQSNAHSDRRCSQTRNREPKATPGHRARANGVVSQYQGCRYWYIHRCMEMIVQQFDPDCGSMHPHETCEAQLPGAPCREAAEEKMGYGAIIRSQLHVPCICGVRVIYDREVFHTNHTAILLSPPNFHLHISDYKHVAAMQILGS